ncbi:hypothetical protein [Jiella marina]|nr:hypothetical protein [Jiella sp. LLJ827]MCQ0989410.1 hypothetical protein [Jiella sp. LLJ827]
MLSQIATYSDRSLFDRTILGISLSGAAVMAAGWSWLILSVIFGAVGLI